MKTNRVLLAGAAALLMVGGAGSFAHADTGPSQGKNCNVYVETGVVECFETFREAIFHATDGLITDAPVDARAAVADPEFTERLDALALPDGSPAPGVTSLVISTHWQHPGYDGDAFNSVRDSGCDGDTGIEHRLYDIDSFDTWWDDRISSFEGYASCQLNLYEDPGYAGARTGWRTRMTDMGPMEDQASSIQWR